MEFMYNCDKDKKRTHFMIEIFETRRTTSIAKLTNKFLFLSISVPQIRRYMNRLGSWCQ